MKFMKFSTGLADDHFKDIKIADCHQRTSANKTSWKFVWCFLSNKLHVQTESNLQSFAKQIHNDLQQSWFDQKLETEH